jgi:hypothetical protein
VPAGGALCHWHNEGLSAPADSLDPRERELLAHVADAWPADGPRRILADYWCDHGDPDRGMFVHAACEGLVAHSHALLGEHGLHWFAPLWPHGFHPDRLALDRGFARPLVLAADSALWAEPDLFRISPIVIRLGAWLDSQPFATTHRATRLSVTGERGEVMVRLPFVRNSGRELLARELDLLGRFSNPQLMRVLEVAQERDGAALVLPRTRGRLAPGVAPNEAARIGVHLATAIADAHRCGVVNGYISLASIWTCDDSIVVDGFATAECDLEQVEYDSATWDPPHESWLCLAPEQTNGEDPSAASDVWAIAMVVATLALGSHPVSARDGTDALDRIRDLAFTRVDPATPLGAVLAQALVRDPSLRPKPLALAAELARIAGA